jgi:hypothetical protein
MSMQQRMADAAAENERLSADQTVSLQREYGTSMETARAAAVKAQNQAVQVPLVSSLISHQHMLICHMILFRPLETNASSVVLPRSPH